ncbi:hypothetical protein [Polaromonas sp.]|uniref:hypothetical protein n=1 Tax=Polaromonas sp. TaxID=1869339 RepID=UPI003569C466
MIIDWLIYGIFVWGVVALINAMAFKQQPANRPTAWVLTIVIFFINLVAMTVLQHLRYQVISQDLGLQIRPKGAVDIIGAFTFSFMFFALLRKKPNRPALLKEEIQRPMPAAASASVPTPVVSPTSMAPAAALSKGPALVEALTTVPAEEFWSDALAEFDSASRRSGLWARSFAEAQGNETLAKANYLRYRASELEHENQEQLAECAREAAQLTKLGELALLSESERAYALLPKGICPNCTAIVPLSSETCSKCTAMFGMGSKWHLKPADES